MGLWTRAIRPPEIPNGNDPADVPPATVGPPAARPGDPHGVVVAGGEAPASPPSRIVPSAWSGWPAEWWPPAWGGQQLGELTDTAWACVDLNASVLATMPPYLVGAAPTLDAAWLVNPNPDVYSSWEEFAKQLFWDYQLGEAFVLCTGRYATGLPARFHVVPPFAVDVEIAQGIRRYRIGNEDVTGDMLHLRYTSTVAQARGVGPLQAGRQRLVSEGLFARYAAGWAASGGIPSSILTHPQELDAEASAKLQAQWVLARQSHLGEPAVLSGGVEWKATQVNPKDAGMYEVLAQTRSGIAVLLGVPPFLVGLPSGGDSMTYQNVSAIFDYHWRAGLRPKAQTVMAGLSEWLLPRGTTVEVNRDAYVQPDPKTRAETAAILHGIVDPQGNPALTVEEIRAAERFAVAGAAGLSQGALA